MIIIRRDQPTPFADLPMELAEDLAALFTAPAPAREFDVASAQAASLRALSRPSPLRPVAIAAGVIVIAAAAALATLPQFGGDGPQPVNAAELLEKSRAAVAQLAQGEKSYYIERHSVIDGGANWGDTQVSKLWSKDAEHWRMEIRVIDPATGEPAAGSFHLTVRNGDDFWIAFQDGDILRVINRSVEAMGSYPARFVPKSTLEEALVEYCDGGVVSDGGPVAGRATYRLECPNVTTLWLDRESIIPLQVQSEGREHYSTTLGLSFDPIGDEVFDYEPPSGTWVNYQDRGELLQVP